MEEKLYFKPANYGKGKKKEQAKQKSKSKTEKNHKTLKLIIVLLILAIVVAVVIWFLRGKTTVSGEFPNPVETKSLTCKKDGIYPKIISTTSEKSEISIASIFGGSTSLRSISLDYTLPYQTEAEISAAEAKAHFEFGEGLAGNNLRFTEFNNKFSKLKEKLVVSVYGSQNDLSNAVRAQYFMVDIEKYGIPKTLEDYETIYKSQGFECSSSDNK